MITTDKGWSAGIDIGGTKVSAVLLDADSEVRGAMRVPTRRGTEGVVDSAIEVISRVCSRAGIETSALQSVGVGVPGLVDPLGGSVTHAVNLGIDGTPAPLAELLVQGLGCATVHVENDVNVAAVGAAKALDLDDLAYLALGTGVAAGLVLDGRLRRGFQGVAGEIGHIPYDLAGARCGCGQIGCLELYASGSAIEAAWPSRWGRPAPAELFEAAAADHPDAVRVRDVYVEAVAACVRLLVLTAGVRHVVLGGGVSHVGTPLLGAVAEALARGAHASRFLRSLDLPGRVRLSPPEVHVAPLGAALLAQAAAPRPARTVSAVPVD